MTGSPKAELLIQEALSALESLRLPAGELGVSLVDDGEIQALNRTWRGIDAPTDVLSFPQDGPAGAVPVLGDIVISVPTARWQAELRGHGLEVELRVLLAHGLAHLLGYDHHTDHDAEQMLRTERALLRALLGTGAPAGLVEHALRAEDGPE